MHNRFEELFSIHVITIIYLPMTNLGKLIREWLKLIPEINIYPLTSLWCLILVNTETNNAFMVNLYVLGTNFGHYLIYGKPYQWAKTDNTNPNLGVGGSVVSNLISKLHDGDHYSFYTDNWKSSLGGISQDILYRKNKHKRDDLWEQRTVFQALVFDFFQIAT